MSEREQTIMFQLQKIMNVFSKTERTYYDGSGPNAHLCSDFISDDGDGYTVTIKHRPNRGK